MKYLALATDYDGTLATDGIVDRQTLEALNRYQAAGGKLILVTGRVWADLQQAFPEVNQFDGVVAENGAVFVEPRTGKQHLLGKPFPSNFISVLQAKNVHPLHWGEIVVSTWQPHGEMVQQTIDEMGLDAQVILNKRSVMVLPKGVNKATGLEVALKTLNLSPQQVAGIGDAENDRDLIQYCGLGVAVENALPSLKAIADHTMTHARGEGVQELLAWIQE
jgi:hydroxymethylpyrimidine pyrophosphatase-like HAD family hydrolase